MIEVYAVWLLLAVAVGIYAGRKGRSGFGWFVLALLLSPIIAGIFALVVSDKTKATGPSPDTHVKCPDCGELVLREAKVCKHCGCKLIPQ